MFLASSYFHPCPTSPLLTYTSPPPSCTSTTTTTTTTSALIENLSKLLLLPSRKKRNARHFPLPAATTSTTATTNVTISTIQSTPTTPITIDRSAPVNVPTAKVASVVVSYPPDQTNSLSAKDAQRNCTEPRSPFTRKLDDDDHLSYRFLPAPDTINPCSNHIQISRPSRTVNRFTASTCSFPPDPAPLATFSYSEIPFLDDLQLEIGDDQREHDGEMSDRTVGYLPMRRSQEPPARRRLSTKPSTADYSVYLPSLPSSSHLFSPSLSPSSFFTPTIPPAVHLLIARKNLPPILYESVQKSHKAIVQGFRSPIQPKFLNRQDPPPRSQVRDVRSNPAHYLMRATETRMILARKLAAPLKSRAVLPKRRVSFAHCGSRLVVTT